MCRPVDLSPKEVTIVAAGDDLHALAVQREVHALGYPCIVADPRETTRSLVYELDSLHDLSMPTDLSIAAATTSVWWRRPLSAAPQEHVRHSENRRFIREEWDAAFYGYLRAIAVQIINDPAAEHRACLKPVQLAAARRTGLAIPRTLITNDPDRASDFINANRHAGRRTIYKPLTPPAHQLGEARHIDALGDRADALRQAPVILQECIERGSDLRVTMVDNHVFAATVESDTPELIDWRTDRNVRYARTTINPRLCLRLRALLASLGLRTGSFDLRTQADGTPYFLEVNPSGQFLFLELELDYPISATLAKALLAAPPQVLTADRAAPSREPVRPVVGAAG